MADLLRIHAFEPSSRANGPGWRAVLWLQGCALGCPGCFNPETHSFAGGEIGSVAEVDAQLQGLEGRVEGLTVSGGEPLQQLRPLTALLRRVRQRGRLSVLLFTGYSWEEISCLRGSDALLPLVDVLIAGRYRAEQRLATGLQGSANKTFHFLTSRYRAADLAGVPEAEIIIALDGEVRLSGIAPPVLAFAPDREETVK